jgi:hypothetical protein
MSRPVLALLILAAVATAASLTWFVVNRAGLPSGSDTVAASRPLQPFSALEVSGAADITLVHGDEEKVMVEGGDGLVVRAGVDGHTLRLTARDSRRWWESLLHGGTATRPARITVTYKQLDAIALSGAVRMSAAQFAATKLRIAAAGGTSVRIQNLRADELRFSGSGALKAELAGQVRSQRIAISGAGEYRADELASDDVNVSVSGVGSVIVRADKTLKASISGAGNIEYVGNPEVRESVSGIGRVKRREASVAPFAPVAGREGRSAT